MTNNYNYPFITANVYKHLTDNNNNNDNDNNNNNVIEHYTLA